MRIVKPAAIAFGIMVLITEASFAQPPDGRGRPDGRGFGGPPNRLLEALDADGNREISADEIENAVAALKTLDRDGDGKLTFLDLRPEESRGRGRANEGRPGRDRGNQSRGRADGNATRGGRPDGDARPSNASRADGDGEGFAARVMSFDENKDGKLSKDELPGRLGAILERHDTDKDGFLDKSELAKLGPPPEANLRTRDGRGDGDASGGNRGRGGGRERSTREGAARDADNETAGRRDPGFGPPSPERFVNFAMSFDADKDGMLSKDELRKFAEQFGRRGGQRGPGSERPEDGGERPRRSARPRAE